jgi:hypothetical protein
LLEPRGHTPHARSPLRFPTAKLCGLARAHWKTVPSHSAREKLLYAIGKQAQRALSQIVSALAQTAVQRKVIMAHAPRTEALLKGAAASTPIQLPDGPQ